MALVIEMDFKQDDEETHFMTTDQGNLLKVLTTKPLEGWDQSLLKEFLLMFSSQ